MTFNGILQTMKASPGLGNMGDWQSRHDTAVINPLAGQERAIRNMIAGWLEYAQAYTHQYESTVASDGVLGDAWSEIGQGMLKLLNGTTGRFDCGTLDHAIRSAFESNGLDAEGERSER